jgi:phosphoserine phosphatase RsbU/P
VLCYTDGVTEARDHAVEVYGEHRLVDLAEPRAAARLPGPGTLRGLSHAVLDRLGGPPTDNATLMLMEWSEVAAKRRKP